MFSKRFDLTLEFSNNIKRKRDRYASSITIIPEKSYFKLKFTEILFFCKFQYY